MNTSTELSQFLCEQESSPAVRGNPREAVESALKRIENVAYTKGVEAALSRIEMLAYIQANHAQAKEIVRMIGRERDLIVAEWRNKIYPK
jgi:hypothetical protein